MALSDFQTGFGRQVKAFREVKDGGDAFLVDAATASDNQSELTLEQKRQADSALESMERALSDYVARQLEGVRPWVEYGMDQIGKSYESDAQAAEELVRALNAADVRVAGRAVTYGADPADNVVGIHRRLTVDVFGQKIEHGDHNIPNGITIRAMQTEANGGEVGVTKVSYDGGSRRGANSLRVKGAGIINEVDGIGPNNPGLAINAVLAGNGDTDDGDAITDGDETTGGINGWNQTRTGAPTVTVDTTNKWKQQTYGLAIAGASVGLKIEQDLEDWDIEDAIPLAYMIPMYQNGSGLDVDVTTELGAQTDSFDESDLTNGAWTPVICTLDENLYPENFDEVEAKFSVDVQLDASNTGEIILGGVYAVQGFQLPSTGEWHFFWERETEPALYAEVSYGADSQTAAGHLAEAWARLFPTGPSLPTSGSTLWSI